MVDFQQRDTSRDRGSAGADDSETSEASEAETHPAQEDAGDEAADETAHDHHAHDAESLGVAVVTAPSSRSRDQDAAGDAIQESVEADGHEVVVRDVVRDDYDGIQSVLDAVVGRSDVDCVVTTGGTGVSPDDVTVEAVRPLFERDLPGFGELFRRRSEAEIGTRVVGTRATAGIADGGVPVFCLPGSENAARLGTESIIVAEAPHLVGLATRGE
jgi:molybdenum cofactor biosynthesis protein B